MMYVYRVYTAMLWMEKIVRLYTKM